MREKREAPDRVAILATSTGLLSFLFPFINFKKNRLVSGIPVYPWNAGGIYFAIPILLVLIASLIVLFVTRRKSFKTYLFFEISGSLVVILGLINLGLISDNLTLAAKALSSIARATPTTSFWLFMLSGYMFISTAKKELPKIKVYFSLSLLLFIILLATSGFFKHTSVYMEYFAKRERFLQELLQHFYLTGFSIGLALIIGLPLGILMQRSKRMEKPVFIFINIVQTIPSLALFGLLIAPLSLLTQSFPLLRSLGIEGIGSAPAIIALTLYALLPITSNTFTGLKVVEPSIIEAGRGMGMSSFQLFAKVEIPLAFPVIFNGVRTSIVQTIGNTAVAALIGAGGLGTFVFQGLGQAVSDLILLGALPIIILAILTDRVLYITNRILTPKGIKYEQE